MNDKVLNKINHFLERAKNSPAATVSKNIAGNFRSNDSLSKAIRNPQEAAIFLDELNAIVKAASKK